MFTASSSTGDRAVDYQLMLAQAESIWEDDLPTVSNLSNISALVKQTLDRTNWVGFYLWNEAAQELQLGPFQGLVACTRIRLGKGVCGAAGRTLTTQRVADVHQFPGHIACDSASESEIVIPLTVGGRLFGVLDIDSPEKRRFDEIDQNHLEAFAIFLAKKLSAHL
jgi:L-methionine (R)-S-oxide reductase